MISLSVLNLIYLGYVDFYESYWSKKIELFNECVFLTIQYTFVLLENLVAQREVREVIGFCLIALTSSLMTVNFIIVVVISVRSFYRKCQLKKIRKQNQLNKKERTTS